MARGYSRVTKLNSWRDAQRQEKVILERLHEDPSLLLAAAGNPLLALEELGYEIDDDHKQQFEDRFRFGADFEQMGGLRKKIFELAGSCFELNSAESLHAVLIGLLEKKVSRTLTLSDTAPFHDFQATKTDPLERLHDAHPILGFLLQYRRRNASVPPFATREVYESIRKGEGSLSVKNITVRTKASRK